MSFNLVHLSQQDPQWKNLKLGNSNLTIGSYGCALTAVAMYLSGFGYAEDPASLNSKMKSRGGFVDAAIVWGAVGAIYANIRFKNLLICTDTDAPIDMIGNSTAAGQPVLLQVDSSPSAGLQTHWVVAYQKMGKDFLVLDPWPYPSDKDAVSLMARYSHGKELKQSISAAVFYQCLVAGSSDGTAVVETPTDGYYVRVVASLEAGLRLRSQPTTASDTLTVEPALTNLKVLETEAGARAKVGVQDQWLQVRDPNGMQGYVAAWFVENAPVAGSVPPVTPPPPIDTTPPATTPQPIQRTRASVSDGLENVNLPPAQPLTINANASSVTRLVGNIWNRYGGLLGALSGVLSIQPGVAVAVLAIESGGQAFAADGRMVIRFENHIFYQYWGKNHADKFNQCFRFNSSQTWTGHQWRPPNSQNWVDCHTSLASEWDVFNFARTLDETAAKMSISMGAPQIMGFNYSVIGYASPNDMFAAFSTSEREQVVGFFDFVQGILPNSGAVKSLQKLDYRSFATSYNGTGQADYYANLMKTAYDAFTALRNSQTTGTTTPPTQPPTQPPAPPVVTPPPVDTTPPVTEPEPPAPPPQTPPTQDVMKVVVLKIPNATGLNLRKEPSLSGAILGTIPSGTTIRVVGDVNAARQVIGKPNQWIEVKDQKGQRGFVAASFVKEVK